MGRGFLQNRARGEVAPPQQRSSPGDVPSGCAGFRKNFGVARFPFPLDFLLLGLELSDPALDFGTLGGRRYGQYYRDRFGHSDRFGGLWRLGADGGRRSAARTRARYPLHKRQRRFDQLIALTHPQFHHAYPRLPKYFPAPMQRSMKLLRPSSDRGRQ